MAATIAQRKAAEELRIAGNKLYQKGKYGAAADMYTEAVTMDPSNPSLFVNRALCAKKQGAPGAWARVASDAETALSLDSHHMKAHYLLGMALRELGQDLASAASHLNRALEQAREKDDAIKDEIWRELAKTNDAVWRAESEQRQKEAEALRLQLRSLAQAASGSTAATNSNSSSSKSVAAAAATPDVDWAALDLMFERATRADTRGEVPSAFTCPLTMEVYRDPVVSMSGHTYERAALIEHLIKVGNWDPITRVPMSLSDMRPNIAMRNAVRIYLEEHGWAWHECF